MYTKNSCCSYCGVKFSDLLWPRSCVNCKNISYLNPLPVSVSLIKIKENKIAKIPAGILLVKRNIEPQKGQWALPGGYLIAGETWQEGAAREIKEEVGLQVKSNDIKLYDVSTSINGNLLIFNYHTFGVSFGEFRFVSNEEVSDIGVASTPIELAFPTHTKYLNEYLSIMQ